MHLIVCIQGPVAHAVAELVNNLAVTSDRVGRHELPVEHRIAWGHGTEGSPGHPEVAARRGVAQGSRGIGDGARIDQDVTEGALAGAVAHLILQRSVKSAGIRGKGVCDGPTATRANEYVLKQVIGECE